jgi:hypothetical protein
MKNRTLKVLAVISLIPFGACSQNSKTEIRKEAELSTQKFQPVKLNPHQYGGWYCPDNLNGFPPVDIANWRNVPVVNGRMATKEETQKGMALIFIDPEKYPNAKPLSLRLPRLATFDSPHSKRKELIIVIQAFNIGNDSIVGFRYLNGGNGSGRLSEINLLSDYETEMIPKWRFFSETITINADPNMIREVMTQPKNATQFHSILEKGQSLSSDWRNTTNVNYHYPNTGEATSLNAGEVWGSFYIQNDYQQFTEKFLVLKNNESNVSELKIVCGPFQDDFDSQKEVLVNWAKKVKAMSEIR